MVPAMGYQINRLMLKLDRELAQCTHRVLTSDVIHSPCKPDIGKSNRAILPLRPLRRRFTSIDLTKSA